MTPLSFSERPISARLAQLPNQSLTAKVPHSLRKEKALFYDFFLNKTKSVTSIGFYRDELSPKSPLYRLREGLNLSNFLFRMLKKWNRLKKIASFSLIPTDFQGFPLRSKIKKMCLDLTDRIIVVSDPVGPVKIHFLNFLLKKISRTPDDRQDIGRFSLCL